MSSKPGSSKFIKKIVEMAKKHPKALHKIGGQAGVKKKPTNTKPTLK